MEKVFIVVELKNYTIERVFTNYKNAVEYADELVANNTNDSEYDVYEREVY